MWNNLKADNLVIDSNSRQLDDLKMVRNFFIFSNLGCDANIVLRTSWLANLAWTEAGFLFHYTAATKLVHYKFSWGILKPRKGAQGLIVGAVFVEFQLELFDINQFGEA